MDDSLAQVRDQFFAGYFARALELAQQLPLLTSDIDRTELFSLVLRSRACLDRSRSETPSPSHVDPATVATVNAIDFWHHEDPSQQQVHLVQLRELAKKHDPIARFLTSSALCGEGPGYDPLEALSLSRSGPLEMNVLRVMQFLLLDRLDQAIVLARRLNETNDDTVLAKLANAAVSIATGNYQEAFLTYCDIQAQCGDADEASGDTSVLILNGKAVASMERGEWQQSMELLKKAYDKNPKNKETLHNLITCCHWLGETKEATSYLHELKAVEPSHFVLAGLDRIASAFASFTVGKPPSSYALMP